MHQFRGNILFADGRVEELSTAGLALASYGAPSVMDLVTPSLKSPGGTPSSAPPLDPPPNLPGQPPPPKSTRTAEFLISIFLRRQLHRSWFHVDLASTHAGRSSSRAGSSAQSNRHHGLGEKYIKQACRRDGCSNQCCARDQRAARCSRRNARRPHPSKWPFRPMVVLAMVAPAGAGGAEATHADTTCGCARNRRTGIRGQDHRWADEAPCGSLICLKLPGDERCSHSWIPYSPLIADARSCSSNFWSSLL